MSKSPDRIFADYDQTKIGGYGLTLTTDGEETYHHDRIVQAKDAEIERLRGELVDAAESLNQLINIAIENDVPGAEWRFAEQSFRKAMESLQHTDTENEQ